MSDQGSQPANVIPLRALVSSWPPAAVSQPEARASQMIPARSAPGADREAGDAPAAARLAVDQCYMNDSSVYALYTRSRPAGRHR